MSVKRCSFIYFVCLPIWKLKELISMFGSSYKKVNTTLEEVSLYEKVGRSKMKIHFLKCGIPLYLKPLSLSMKSQLNVNSSGPKRFDYKRKIFQDIFTVLQKYAYIGLKRNLPRSTTFDIITRQHCLCLCSHGGKIF